MKTKPHVFKTFPEFSKLTLADREKYEELIADYPPYADFSFSHLMTWWSGLSSCRVAQLNGNLIIAYWFPGYEAYSGLSVIGTHEVDETIAIVMDHLKQSNNPARLVHVPEFVASSMRFPELYAFADERDYDECILSVANMSALGNLIRHKRWKVRKFLAEVDEEKVAVKSLDLGYPNNQELLLDSSAAWEPMGGLNNICKHEKESLPMAIKYAESLGIENVCVFIDGRLHSFFLYERSADQKYAILNYARISYAIPHIFELIAYKNAQWFAGLGMEYLNIKCDLGLSRLRTHKLSLAPANFFRKYTVRPIT